MAFDRSPNERDDQHSDTLKEVKSDMIKLYFHKSPNTYKIAMLLEEAGVEYETAFVNVGRGVQFEPWFKHISPNSKVPVIIDSEPWDEGENLVLFESNAILTYLAEKYDCLLPRSGRGRWSSMQWLYWQAAGQGPMSGQSVHFNAFAPDSPYAKWRFDREVDRLLAVLDGELAKHEYMIGDAYTIVDIACFPWVHKKASHCYGQPTLEEFPNIRRWRDAIDARPATVAAYERLHRDEHGERTNLEEFCRNQFGHDPGQAKDSALRARDTLIRAGLDVDE